MRDYKDWEKCALNMSGIHTWTVSAMTGPEGKKRRNYVRCNRCGTEPPTVHRARIYNEIEEARRLLAEEKEAARLWKEATSPRRR